MVRQNDFCFNKIDSKEEIISSLQNNTYKESRVSSNSGIFCNIKHKCIILQKRSSLFRNPFQRIFVCRVYKENDGSIITGYFSYRIIVLVPFTLLTLFFIYKNIEALISIKSLTERAIVTLLFSIFYLVIGALFITGKSLYKKQESDIIEFLRNI